MQFSEQDIGAQETHPEYGIHKAWKRAKRLNESEFLKGLEEAMTAKNFNLIKSKLLGNNITHDIT